DIDLSEDGNTLWVVNLEARSLVRLNVANGAQPTSLTSFSLASASGTPTCTNGVLRPWALKLTNGKGYLGVVCTGENATGTPTQTRSSLSAHVLSFNPATTGGTMAFTQELNITDMTFNRGLVWNAAGLNYDGAFQWNYWDSTLDASKMCRFGPPRLSTYPTPILGDIEFDNNGDMILGFIDRTSMQLAGSNYGINGDTDFFRNFSGGDILKACQSNGTFQLENNGMCGGVAGSGVGNGEGPGGGEFFGQETTPLTGASVHAKVGKYGLALLRGLTTSDVVSVMMDPVTYTSGGLGWFSTTDGEKSKAYEVYAQVWPGSTGKASGLGDVELFCPILPLELGNHIWLDINNDGCQDPDEVGIDGIAVNQYKNWVLVGQTTTANGGHYLFNDSNVTLNGASGILPKRK
ncbi:MAG: SdrD B-like domain-containing protein, partial [Blastocatellia bacterium]